jgi:alkylation response protein AidB-like acyl-CoA dehydrogenase
MSLFDLDETEHLVQKTAREFADRELAPRAAERDRTGTFPVAELRALADLGLLGVNIPAALGGAEAGPVAYALAMQEIARGDASVAVAMAVTNMVGEVICKFGSDAQQRRTVPRLTSGAAVAGAFALSEAQAGSDPAGMGTTATRTPSGWRLDGSKLWITSGDRAGVMVVWAKTDKTAGARGISAFLLEREIVDGVAAPLPGLTVGRPEDKMGLRGSSTVPLTFDGCELPADALLGKEGEGLKVALLALDGGRIGIAAQALGIARAALEATRRYVRERQQFGRALADFQATQFRLATVATELEAAHLLALRAAHHKGAGLPFSIEASMAKLWSTEAAFRACDAAVQLHGGYGYTREFVVERLYRDVRVSRIYEGTSEIQRVVISRALVGKNG